MNDQDPGDIQTDPAAMLRVAAVEGAVEALVALSGGVAHDFSNVFQTLVFGLQATHVDGVEDAEIRTQLAEVRAGCDRGVRLLRSLGRLGARPSAARQLVFPHDVVPALAPSLRRALALTDPIEVLVEGVSAPVRINPAVLDGAVLVACVAAHQHGPGPIRIVVQESEAVVSIVVSGSAGSGALEAVAAVFAERLAVVGPRVTTVCGRIRDAGGGVRVEAGAEGGAIVVIELPRYVAGARIGS